MRIKNITASVLVIASLILIVSCIPSSPEKAVEAPDEPVAEPKPVAVVEQPAEEVVKPVMSCEDWAVSIFPSQWIFYQDVMNDPALTKAVLTTRENKWKDGTPVGGISSVKVENGSAKGENINYYYLKPIFMTLSNINYGFSYSKDVVSDDGTILGSNYFMIRPSFKPIFDTVKEEKNDQGVVVVRTRELSLIIDEPNFLNCTLVQ